MRSYSSSSSSRFFLMFQMLLLGYGPLFPMRDAGLLGEGLFDD
jgi:hypothetical protein